MPSDGDYRWRRDFSCAYQVSFNEKCGQKGDRAVIIYQNECWKTHPLWFPPTGFPITQDDRPWAGLICSHNHLTLVKTPVIDYTKSNHNGNAGRWYIKCLVKDLEENFNGDATATLFLAFADEALQKMVQYDEYDPDHDDVQYLQHNYYEFQQQMSSQVDQGEELSIDSEMTKWATNTSCFTSISQQFRRHTQQLGSTTEHRRAPLRPVTSTLSNSTLNLPQAQGDRIEQVESWLDENGNFMQPEIQPEEEPFLSEESESEISYSDTDTDPNAGQRDARAIKTVGTQTNTNEEESEEETSIITKLTDAMYRLFINV